MQFRKGNKAGKQDAQGLADALAQVSYASQALQWLWQERSFVSVLYSLTDYPSRCCGQMIYSRVDLGQWLQHRLFALKFGRGDDQRWGILEAASGTGSIWSSVRREAYYLDCSSFVCGQSPRRAGSGSRKQPVISPAHPSVACRLACVGGCTLKAGSRETWMMAQSQKCSSAHLPLFARSFEILS